MIADDDEVHVIDEVWSTTIPERFLDGERVAERIDVSVDAYANVTGEGVESGRYVAIQGPSATAILLEPEQVPDLIAALKAAQGRLR